MKVSIGKNKGFTLIEIMIVVGIIALLATIALPQMLRARMNANELVALSALRTISTACQAYYNDVNPRSYPGDLAKLADAVPPYIATILSDAEDTNDPIQYYRGYYFEHSLPSSERFSTIAWPKDFNRTGSRNFFVNEIGAITYTNTANDRPDQSSPGVE